MGGVDKSDQLLSYYTFHHRTVKWWKRAAFHLLNLACVNAYIVYTETALLNKLIHELFLVEVAKGLLKQAGIHSDELEDLEHMFPVQSEVSPSFRLSGRYFTAHMFHILSSCLYFITIPVLIYNSISSLVNTLQYIKCS